MSQIQAVSFDLVGTLITVRGTVGAQYASIASAFGIDADPARLDAAFRVATRSSAGISYRSGPIEQVALEEKRWWRALVRDVFQRAGVQPTPDDCFDPFFERLFQHFATASAWEIYPDAMPALEHLEGRGIGRALVTNFDLRVQPLLRSTGLAPFFEVIAVPAFAGYVKPERGIFEAALGELRLNPDQAAHIGDSLDNDVRIATAIGMKAAWLDRRGRVAPPGIRRIASLHDLGWLYE